VANEERNFPTQIQKHHLINRNLTGDFPPSLIWLNDDETTIINEL